MIQAGGNVPDIQALGNHDGGGGVPEAVKRDRPQAVFLDDLLKLLRRAGYIQPMVQVAGENRVRFVLVRVKHEFVLGLFPAVLRGSENHVEMSKMRTLLQK